MNVGGRMSQAIETSKAAQMSLPRIALGLLRHYLGGRRGLMVLTVVVLAAGAYFNWGWLVAAGLAPLLVALAPCAAMCALGLCMNKMGGKASPSGGSTPGEQNGAANGAPPVSPTEAGDGRD